MERKVLITTDGVCDLPEEVLQEYGIPTIHFYITTDHGCFRDLDEITSSNIIEYFANGGKHIATTAPSIDDYAEFFEYHMKQSGCDEIIHITITAELSKATQHATAAAEKFNGKIHVFNSMHLSSGVAHFVLRAVELAKDGKSRDEILQALTEMYKKVSTSFIAEDADYLYRNNRVNKYVKSACEIFQIHPVLGMRNGNMYLKSVRFGNYKKAILRYVQKELKKAGKIDSKRLFITHASCPLKIVEMVKKTVQAQSFFEEILTVPASATITSNCGANTIGVLFVKE